MNNHTSFRSIPILLSFTVQEQISRYNREQGDADEKYFDDSPYWQKVYQFYV